MTTRLAAQLLAAASLLALASCGDRAKQDVAAGTGPHPVLLPEQHDTIPTLNIAPARGWAAGAKPIAAPGLAVTQLAGGLDHPRNLYVLPNGDILVAETNAPADRPKDSHGHQGFYRPHGAEAGRGRRAEPGPHRAAARGGGRHRHAEQCFSPGCTRLMAWPSIGDPIYTSRTPMRIVEIPIS